MRTLIHLSDLHFGHTDPELLQPLRACIHSLSPHLVIVSGDLTQRARSAQFADARAYLDTLPSPQLVVPGNHDVPLYNIFARLFQPLKKYTRYIHPELNPVYRDEEIAVVGLNSARSLVIKDGRLNHEQIDLVRRHFHGLAPQYTKIVVTHHPFELPQAFADGKTLDQDEIINRADVAMAAFAELGTDVLLSGHLHMSNTTDTQARYPHASFSALVIQAGTATSTRARGESNSFNVLKIDTGRIAVLRYVWTAENKQFRVAKEENFHAEGERWLKE